MLELSGVLDGCSISARSAASLAFSAAFSASRRPTRAFKVAFSASSTSTRAASSAIRDSSAAGSVLVSDEERAAISAGNAMRRLPHKPSSAATKIGNVIAGTPSRPSRRPISPPSRVSNYPHDDPRVAIASARKLCERLIQYLEFTFNYDDFREVYRREVADSI